MKGGPRVGAGRKPIEERITLNLSRGDKTLLDQRRGRVSRSAYVRELVRKDLQMNTDTQIDFTPILEAFLESPDFAEGCKAATIASWNGSGYSVELAPNGVDGWRVLWNDHIGNKYDSPGEIIGLPTLNDDDYSECVTADNAPMTEDEYFLSVFQNDEDELKQFMRNKLAGVA